jgi:hypothetical protein
MSNTLTSLAPTLFSAAKQVASEPFGVIPAINTTFDAKGVAKGDVVTVDVAPTRAATDFTPGATTTTGDDSVAGSIPVKITAAKKVSWHLTGEQIRSLENATINQDWVKQLAAQGMRTLRNMAEVDAATALKQGASRAYGTAGTQPFPSDLSALTNARKILQDNGCPMSDMWFMGDSNAGLGLRNLGIFQQAYAAGTDAERRSGDFLPQFGFKIKESAGIGLHTKGTGASYTTDTAGYAVGATVINLITGTGTAVPGDVTTFAGDTNKYVVASGITAPGAVTLQSPGLRVAIPASAVAVTIGNNYTANMAFERSACVGIIRPTLMPENPTITQMPISDDLGMTYLMLDIAQYGQRTWEMHLAWGFKTVNGEFSTIVLG